MSIYRLTSESINALRFEGTNVPAVNSLLDGVLGSPNPYTGAHMVTFHGQYCEVHVGEWLIRRGNDLFVLPDEMFRLLFEEVPENE